jgi:TM2 domain-containing membrane protein YozV
MHPGLTNETFYHARDQSPSRVLSSMNEICPHCGKVSNEESPRFCSGCGARMDGSIPAGYPGYPVPQQPRKNQMTAGLCSTFLPGLGQVYNGQAGKGFAVFLLILAGIVMLVIPGLIVWLYGMYDAYIVAGKMNSGELVFRETRMLHMVLFLVFAAVIVVIALIIIIAMVMATLNSQLGQLGMSHPGSPGNSDLNQILGSSDLSQLLGTSDLNQVVNTGNLSQLSGTSDLNQMLNTGNLNQILTDSGLF